MSCLEPQMVYLVCIQHHVNGSERGGHGSRLEVAVDWPVIGHCERHVRRRHERWVL